MAHPRNLSDFSGSVAKARAEDGDVRGAAEAALHSMLANQRAVAEAMAKHPEPVEFDEYGGGDAPDDYPLTERQQITRDVFEEYETDRMWGREDE